MIYGFKNVTLALIKCKPSSKTAGNGWRCTMICNLEFVFSLNCAARDDNYIRAEAFQDVCGGLPPNSDCFSLTLELISACPDLFEDFYSILTMANTSPVKETPVEDTKVEETPAVEVSPEVDDAEKRPAEASEEEPETKKAKTEENGVEEPEDEESKPEEETKEESKEDSKEEESTKVEETKATEPVKTVESSEDIKKAEAVEA